MDEIKPNSVCLPSHSLFGGGVMVQTAHRELRDRPGRTRKSDGSLQNNCVLGMSGSNTLAHIFKPKSQTHQIAGMTGSALVYCMQKKWAVKVIDLKNNMAAVEPVGAGLFVYAVLRVLYGKSSRALLLW